MRKSANRRPYRATRIKLSAQPWKISTVFDPIERILHRLEADCTVDSAQGRPVFYEDSHRGWYDLVEALRGLIVDGLKDSGVTYRIQDIADASLTHAAGTNTLRLSPGYAAPYPVATPPAGQDIVSAALSQDLVIKNVFTGSGATTFTQTIVPVR